MIDCMWLILLTKFRRPAQVIYITARRDLLEDAGGEGSAYTMPMGRKGAILMLAIVALWAAGPAVACLAPAPCHQCCRAMTMHCDFATMSAAHPCCQLQSPATAIPLGRVVAPEPQIGAVQSFASALPPNLDGIASQSRLSAKAPPPRSLSGASTILQI